MMKKIIRRRKARFPTFAVIILLIALAWILNDLNIININVPWLPVILAVVALGWIIDRYR